MPRLHFSRPGVRPPPRCGRERASSEKDSTASCCSARTACTGSPATTRAGTPCSRGCTSERTASLALLTRTADRIQSRDTSIVKDIRIWHDREDASPGDDLRTMLEDRGCRGKRLGVEYHAYGLTGQRAKMVDAALDGFCELVDASDLVRMLRLVKSEEELAYVRRAGALCDRMLAVSVERTVPGASVKSVYGAMMQALMKGGGDPAASRWPMGAGDAAVFCRYHTGDETVGPRDQVVFEPAAAYRHYHAAMMYNILTGTPDPRHVAMNRACADAIDACQEVAASGEHGGRRVRRAREARWPARGSATPRSPPAATPWGRCIRRPGWTGPWCGPGTRRCWSPEWCSSCT